MTNTDNVTPIKPEQDPPVALARVTGPPTPSEWNAMVQQANTIAKTEFVPAGLRGKPEAVLACVLTGRELGIGPMQALQSIAVIDGKPNLSAELQRALVIRAGHRVWVDVKSSYARGIVRGRRCDSGQEDIVEWTMDDARQAGLADKRNWKTYPRQMLVARATSELVSRLFPDVLAGISYTADELTDGEVVAAEDVGEVETVAAEPVEEPSEEEKARRRLWTLFRERYGEDAEAKLRSAIAPLASTKELEPSDVDALIWAVSDPEWEPEAVDLPNRLRNAANAEWTPTEKDAESSGDAVEERRMALGLAADIAEECNLDDDGLAQVIGFKTPMPTLALSSLRQAVDKLEAFALVVQEQPGE